MDTAQQQTHKTILVIEDEKPLAEAIKMKLEQKGLAVKAVPLAEEGLDIIKKEAVDLIWLDLLLPKMSGLQFLETLKEDPSGKKWRVVVVSNSGTFDTKAKAISLGADAYLIKSDMSLENIITAVVEKVTAHGNGTQ